MKISGFSLLYLSRDNPFEFREYAEQWGPRRRDEIRDLIKNQKKIYRAAVNSFIQDKPELAMKCKPCQVPDDYERLMPAYEDCPMEKVCFSKKLLKEVMHHGLPADRLISVLDMTNNMKNYVEDEDMPRVKKKKLKDPIKKLKSQKRLTKQ